MNQRDIEYRKAKADGMRTIADLFKVEKPWIYELIREMADRTEKVDK